MQQTNFNYIVSSEDNGISSPDTGTYTTTSTDNGLNNDNTNYFINSATIISLALILLSFIFFIVKKKGNKTKAFNDGVIDLKYKNKNNIISSIFAIILLLSGLITLITTTMNYTTATPAPNDDFTTKKDVTTTVTLNKTGSVIACATDTITMTNDLAGGYTLDFTASNINPTISSITEYELTIDDATPTTITPDDTITIKDITTATSAGDTTDVTLCISFPADIEPGTYTVTGAYAQQVINYTITYDLADGTLPTGSTNPTTYNVETNTFTLINPERTNYTFTGWTGSNGTTPQTTVTIAKGTTGNLSYTANWERLPYYTVEFNSNGGTGTMDNQYINTGEATDLIPNSFTAPTNKRFKGWNTKADGTGENYIDKQSVTNLVNTNETITLYAQWGCPALQICYDDNGANSPTTMSNQEVSSSATSVTLWASNFQYTGGGYGFAGWNTKANGTGTSYGPNEDITDEATLNKIKSEGLDLYAMWIPSAGNLQNWNGCNNMNIGDVTALTDTRDNNTYAVAKLADNQCWMIENLRLGGEEPITLNSNNTNLAQGASFTLPASQDPTQTAWCDWQSSADCYNQSMLSSNNTTNTISNMTSSTLGNKESKGIYSMGNYYNWYSATAGTGTYSTTRGNATGSICPAGWHLPTGYTNGEFSALDIAMGGTGAYQNTTEASRRWRTYPANYVLSGLVSGSSLYSRGVFGDGWSSTANTSNTVYGLYFGSGRVSPGMDDGTLKYTGYSVRCAF